METRKDELFLATTDTTVGIGAIVSRKNAAKIFKIKDRDATKKLIIMIASIKQLQEIAHWNELQLKYAQKYWPGSVTFIVDNQAFRMPDSLKLRNLIEKMGPIYMTSANKSGQESLDMYEAKKAFPEIKTYYDFGESKRIASTIYNIDTNSTIRKGAIKVKEIK